jgi:NTE family protein
MGLGRLGELLPASKPGAPVRLAGVLDTTALEAQVLDQIPWSRIRRNLNEGRLHALAVAATEIATGRSIVFVDEKGGAAAPQWTGDPFIVARPTRIGPAHALASAAIPLVFSAVRINRAYYCDGGLRLNTPLSPALRLGADRVLVIGLRYPFTPREEDQRSRRREAGYLSTLYLAGKVLNALLLDRVEYDVDRLRLFNAFLESGTKAYGEGFLEEINKPLLEQRNAPYRIIRNLYLRPSRDLGEIAAECLGRKAKSRSLQSWASRVLASFAARGAAGEADLLSYLFFDRCYAEELIELGRQDAKNAADELVAFFS